jgi:hypothetical protein
MQVLMCAVVVLGASAASAQTQMPDPRAMSGLPLPSSEIPPGSLSVRVMRGSFDQNVANQPVEVRVDGAVRTVTTGEDGRAIVSGLRVGNTVRLATTVDGERVESQDIQIGASGIQVALVASAPGDRAAAAAPAVAGSVVLGPESRVIVELAENALTVFYYFEVVNSAKTPVDIGGPLLFDLPQEARGTSILQDSSKQATAAGARVIVTGPFAPGVTLVAAAYELPYSGPTARLEQLMPATLQQLSMFVQQRGEIEVASPQIAARNPMSSEGQAYIFANGPAIAQGQTLTVDFSGLPHHKTWPNYVAIALALAIILWGVWGAATAAPRVRSRA